MASILNTPESTKKLKYKHLKRLKNWSESSDDITDEETEYLYGKSRLTGKQPIVY